MTFEKSKQYRGKSFSWLSDVPELYSRRAPGNTCLSALKRGAPVSGSKGCGGIMRVAPLALNYHKIKMDKLDKEGAAKRRTDARRQQTRPPSHDYDRER